MVGRGEGRGRKVSDPLRIALKWVLGRGGKGRGPFSLLRFDIIGTLRQNERDTIDAQESRVVATIAARPKQKVPPPSFPIPTARALTALHLMKCMHSVMGKLALQNDFS